MTRRRARGGAAVSVVLAAWTTAVSIWGGAYDRVAAAETEALDLEALAAPSFEIFTSRDGLPDGVITVIGVDADDFAWAASPQGLYRFVGHRWQRRLPPGEAGRVHRRMTLDSRGRLWVPSLDRGVTRLESPHHLERFEAASGLPTDHVYRVTESSFEGGAVMWLLTASGLYREQDGRWIADRGNPSLPPGLLLSFAVTESLFGEARQWIGTGEDGLFYRPVGDHSWRPYAAHGLPPGQVEDLQVSHGADGEALWVSVFGEGLWRLGEDDARRWNVASGDLRSNEIYGISLSEPGDGPVTAWVASRAGLVRVRGDSVEVFDRRHGLPSDQVRSTALWRGSGGEEVLWIATENGAARAVLDSDRWRTVSLMGSGTLGVFGVEIEPDGQGGERLWVASTRDGLGLYEQGRWRRFSDDTGHLPGPSLRMIRRAPDLAGADALWAGLLGGDLVRVDAGPAASFDPRSFRVVATPWPKITGQAPLDVLGRVVDGRRELWVVTRLSGPYRWRADGWTRFDDDGAARPATGAPEEAVDWRGTDLLEQIDDAGRSWLWLTSSRGLYRLDGERWTLLDGIEGLPERNLLGLSLSADGSGRQILWIGSTFDALVRLDVTHPLAPTVVPAGELPPPIDMTVYGARHDSQGRIYVCANAGVQRLIPDGEGGWSERVFGRADGMIHEECNTNAQLVDRHDRFWTGTLGGLTVYDPGRTRPGSAPRLRLVEMRIDNREVPPGEVVVPPGRNEVQVEFTLQSWQRENENRYRTRLLGLESEPGPWSAQSTRTLVALPPGRHRLRIEARDWAGVEADPMEVELVVVPSWWQRRGVQGAAALGAALLLVALAQWRTRNLRLRTQQLAELVAERTEELNAANERLRELSYTDALTGLANRRRLLRHLHGLVPAPSDELSDGDDGPVLGPGGDDRVALIFIDVDHFKRYNDRLGHPAGDEALRAVADCLVARAPDDAVVARYGGEEFACLVTRCDLDRARALAEGMRREVESRTVEVPGSATRERVTISAGIATARLETEADIHRLLRDADHSLYEAKAAGRNCVRSAGDGGLRAPDER